MRQTLAGTARSRAPWWVYAAAPALLAVVGAGVLHAGPSESSAKDMARGAKQACREEFLPKRLGAPAKVSRVSVTSDDGMAWTVAGRVNTRKSFTCVVYATADGEWMLDSIDLVGRV